MRLILILLALLLCAGCCCRRAPAATQAVTRTTTIRAPGTATERCFVLLRATPLQAAEDGARQILLEGSAVTVSGDGGFEALRTAERLDTLEAPAWRHGTEMPDLARDSVTAVFVWPSVVTRDGEEARISVNEITPGDASDSMGMRISPTLDEGGVLTMRLFYRRQRNGVTVHAIRGASLQGPPASVFIIEALEAR